MKALFVELPTFAISKEGVITDVELFAVQSEIVEEPRRGDAMPRTGGWRKIRSGRPGMGKRGGARIIYLYVETAARVYFGLAYAKNVRDTLSAAQEKALRDIARAIKEELR